MYYYVKHSKSKAVHREYCGHLKIANQNNVLTFDNLAQALDKGYHPCEHCSKVGQKMRKEKEFLKSFCKDKHMVMNYNHGWLDIKTPYCKWRIIETKGGFALYHKNERGKTKGTFLNTYHRQQTELPSFKSLIKYIYEHDCYREHNPFGMKPPKVKKNLMKGSKKYKSQQNRINKYNQRASAISRAQRLDFLFEQIGNHSNYCN